jgi:hypothetical protein
MHVHKSSFFNLLILVILLLVKSQRAYIDYTLDKRATLLALYRGIGNACDADPYLLLAAKFHGVKVERPCPVCKKKSLVELRYTFGDQLGQFSGRIKSMDELAEMEKEFGEFRVYIVEVCRECSWNHLCVSFALGDGIDRKAPRRQRTREDEDWVKR